ncbi:MAG: AAA family ATPase, partial [Sulfolobales archaeon]
MPLSFEDASLKSQTFLRELEAPFVGRHEEALVITLALLSGEHGVLIGEPGTAKSAMVRRAASLLNARFFKYLLTKYTEPSELFGPIDIRALRKGVYARVTRGKLSEAEIAFLDEIFNASSAVLNSLLSIMMERVVYDGYTEIKTPLWSLFGASNRVPEEPELEALYDRFLLRSYVKPLDQDHWPELL